MSDKTRKTMIIIILVFLVVAIFVGIFLYQKNGGGLFVQQAVTPTKTAIENGQTQVAQEKFVSFDVKIPEEAGGFMGLAEGVGDNEQNNAGKIYLRGHWTVDNKPTFDFIGHPNYVEAANSLPLKTIVINKDTKIAKIDMAASPSRTTAIAWDDLKTELLKNESYPPKDPIFAVFSQQTKTDKNELVAAQLIIFSGYSQS